MPDETLKISLSSDREVTAVHTPPETRSAGWLFIYAPGAGSNVHDPFGRYLSRALAGEGVATVRIQFPYMEEGRRRPDRTPVLEATWRAAIAALGAPNLRLAVGGRSLGGRIASQVVSGDGGAAAVALFAYPLHPPGKPEQLRDEHLNSIPVPMLFCTGTRDAFAAPDELRLVAEGGRDATLHLLEGADHGFSVSKRSGRTREDVWREATRVFLDWLPR